jgi:single-stranded-DNA-specific exonuclease
MFQKPKWRIRRAPNPEISAEISNYSPIGQTLLLARGIRSNEEASAFLDADHAIFHDPFMLTGMDRSVELVLQTIQSGGKICIFADYDADGITAASLLYRTLKENKVDPVVYFPDRFKEGYGLNTSAIEQLASEEVSLIITVDCGIRGISEAELAIRLGMELIITDHHIPGDRLPPASSIINPRQLDDVYPFKDLAGVGVAYKLAEALSSQLKGASQVQDYLDLVAIGTIADMVPVIGENRHLVQHGLRIINESTRPGLEALIHVSGVQPGSINSGTIGFNLAPRINAAGRLASAMQAFELLVENDSDRARGIAERLDRLNTERQRLTTEVMEKAEEHPPSPSEKIIFLFDQEFHQGVVGLAASRISDQYYRPAIVGTIGNEDTRASARSIPGFHLTQALEEVSDLLLRYGGHQAAAGFTIDNSKRDTFIDRLLEVADEKILDGMLIPIRDIDACIGLDSVETSLMTFLDKLEPFGNKNNQPVFCTEGVNVLAKRTVGRDASHLKLTLEGAGRPFDAIAFRMGEMANSLPDTVDIAFHIERNNYLGYETLQLRVVDIRSANSLGNEELTEWIDAV